jgi:hypothetical protein
METAVGDAYVRAFLRRAEAGWGFHHVWALVGAEPPGWLEQTWQYDDLAFVACAVPAAVLAGLCETAGGVVTLGGLSALVPGPTGPANWARRPSFARHDRLQLPWPVTDYRIAVADSASRQLPHEMLVAEGCPSFPEPQSAWRAFCEGDFSLAGAQGLPQELAVFRFAVLDGWIGHVHVTPTELTVDIHGGRVAGSELELFGEAGRCSLRLAGSGPVALRLDRGLPASAWLWLKRGTSWLDYRSIDSRSGWTGDVACADVGLVVDKGSRDKPEFYVRRGSSTYPAQPDELRLAARSRPPADETSHRRTPFGPW